MYSSGEQPSALGLKISYHDYINQPMIWNQDEKGFCATRHPTLRLRWTVTLTDALQLWTPEAWQFLASVF
jgi:hypothetical protein